MKTFTAEFVKTECSFDADFGHIQTAGAGDYEKGYEIGYEEGHQKGYADGETNGYSKGYTDGQASVQNPLEHALVVSNMFKGANFLPNHELSLNIPVATDINALVWNTTGVKKVTLKGNINNNTINFSLSFLNSANLEIIDLTEYNAKIGNAGNTFSSPSIKEILGELDFSDCTSASNTFTTCRNLKKITIKAGTISAPISFSYSNLLSAESVQSIINGLAYVDTPQTITFHKNTVLTDEQRATISSKGWTLVQ